jgi:CelD/BcsL family acetyltransferase involved in cellulose biosynthesis
MSASLRRNIRHGRRKGTVVREGTEEDLPVFFDLMSATCRRQDTAPNPANLDAIRRLWRLFAPSKSIRVTFAECGGAMVAAKLSLRFGRTVSVWKKGWDGTHSDWHPNELLEEDAFAWAHANGCQSCDFCSFDRFAAAQMLAGRPVSGASLSSRDEYHRRFGGTPRLLPPALVLIPHRILRWLFCQTLVRRERRRGPDRE